MDRQIRKTIQEHRLLEDNEVVLVAVSGGPDSIALLHWLKTHERDFKIKVACAHFNHGLRGEESDGDEQFVQNFCKEYDIACFTKKEYIKENHSAGNLQAYARNRRYAFLQETAISIQAQKIAFAHHRDDQVETVLMRLIRGTGTSGLLGMPYKRALDAGLELIRPFLDITKEEIYDYLKLHQLASRIDSSNFKLDYTRNRIRLKIIPELLRINPEMPSSILNLSRMLKEDEQYLNQQARTIFEHFVTIRDHREVSVQLSDWRGIALTLQRRVIKLILNYLAKNEEEVSFHHLESICSLLNQDEPGLRELPWGLEVVARYGEGIFRHKVNSETIPYSYPLPIPGSIHIPEVGCIIRCSIVESQHEEETPYRAYFDYNRITPQLVVRSRRQGDRVWVKGLNGHKKVKDIFIDRKIPREQRNRIPLICAGTEIIWIPGIVKSGIGSIDSDTKPLLCCEYIENG